MVSSKLNDEINYKETRTIDEDDMGISSVIYEMEIKKKPIKFVLGKQKFTYSGKHVLYYPIYLVNDDRIKSKIGIFELNSNKALNILDNDGDVDLNALEEPLLFSFVTPVFLENALKPKVLNLPKHNEKEDESDSDSDEHLYPKHKIDSDSNTDISSDDEDTDDHTTLKIPETEHSKQINNLKEKTKDGLLELEENISPPTLLIEEDEKDDRDIKKSFIESSKQLWIQKYMKNPNYEIIDVESNGDCFFATVREAFRQIGYKTTVDKMRHALAKEMPERIFTDQFELYNSYQSTIDEIDKRIIAIQKENIEYKKRMKKASAKEDREEILANVERLKQEYTEKNREKKMMKDEQSTYVGYMEHIKTVEQYRDYVQSSRFWADTWAISTIEKLLNVKFIIMSEIAYNEKAMHSVLNCGEVNKYIQDRGVFNPDYYIMVTYSGNHYRLITYKDKLIFKFREIPYGIKVLVVNKCLEKNAGSFYLIEDFRNFKAKQGIHPDTGNPKRTESEQDEDERHRELYDDDVIFMFHQNSELSAKPGKGSGEKINIEKVPQFSDLAKTKEWRRMLDDTWSDVILSIDNLKWKSVEHYIQASKFKNGFPDFYRSFSIESESDISKNVEYAKSAGESGKLKKKSEDGKKSTEIILRAKTIHQDENYNAEEVRKTAIESKFTQNEDVKQILLSTKHAKLIHFSRGNAGNYVDIPLMELRQKLSM